MQNLLKILKNVKRFIFEDKSKRKHYAKLKKFGSIHDSCQVHSPVYIVTPQNVFMEEYSRIQFNVTIINSEKGKVIIKKYSAISPGTTIIPGAHIPTVGLPQFFSANRANDKDNTIIVEEDVWVGADSRLLSNAKIGRGSVVGTGSIVTKEIPPYAVVAGSPARIIGVRFDKSQILEHERRLYPENERLSNERITELFKLYYEGKKVIGESKFSSAELDSLWASFNI